MNARFLCKEGTLDPEKVKGKIVACLRGDDARVDKGRQAFLAGAVGMILCNDKLSGDELIADPHVIPASQINYKDGARVIAYINSFTCVSISSDLLFLTQMYIHVFLHFSFLILVNNDN